MVFGRWIIFDNEIGEKEMKKIMKDKMWLKISHCMPRTLVLWCAMRLLAHATSGKWDNQIVSELKIFDALDRWDK